MTSKIHQSCLKQDSRGFYRLACLTKNARVGYRFDTTPNIQNFVNDVRDFEVVEVTGEFFSAVTENDAVWCWCKFIGEPNQ